MKMNWRKKRTEELLALRDNYESILGDPFSRLTPPTARMMEGVLKAIEQELRIRYAISA